MPTYNFQAYPATASAKFTCSSCQKPNRTRTFRCECTANPFNKKDDGTMRTPTEVRAQSYARAAAERDAFMRHPLCAACENALDYQEQKALREKRHPEAA